MANLTLVLTRRSFAFGVSAAAGGLVLASAPLEAWARTADIPDQRVIAPEVTIWVVIEPDDTTIIRVARSEMGQGSFTALPMLVAEELECDWSRVRAEYVDPRENVVKGRPWGDMATVASLAIRGPHSHLRKDGAQTRTMLISEAAARWGVDVTECSARGGVVQHTGTSRALRYGELAQGASRRPVPADVPLKAPSEWRLIGTSVSRVDTPEKVLGRPIYVGDVRLPGMLFASYSACPAHGGRLKGFDGRKALRMPGVRQVIPVQDMGVAVLADSWWQARKAMDAVSIEWDTDRARGLSSDAIRDGFVRALDAEDVAIGQRIGDVDAALAAAGSHVRADYDVPYLAHTTMEPQTCTAHVIDGRAEIWAPTQNGEGTVRAVAKVLQLDPSAVTVHKHHLGGGFGRRGGAQDWAMIAALIARSAGVPIKMIWTREEDVQHDYYRPLVVARQSAAFDTAGNLVAWKVRLCGSSNLVQLAPDRLKNGQDIEMMGAFLKEDMAYRVPNFEVGYVMRNTPVPVGFWRGVNHSQNGFFRESFVDEMAHARGEDPYQFRRKLLASSPRSLAVVDAVAKLGGWGRPRSGVFQGMAVVECYNSVSAQVVDLSIGEAGEVIVHRVSCALDAVHVVNPGIVEAQMQGAVVYALGAALAGEITFKDGRVLQSNFSDYPALRMNQVPEVAVALVSSGDKYTTEWGGVGEPGTPPLAPALCNAVFAATGQRIRSLPLSKYRLTPTALRRT
jgi:isoquinoline 1-oxidoreductase subunit beta